jgi:predicted ATPase/DNA-binding winged helix-turn-helix (wHTH) protein
VSARSNSVLAFGPFRLLPAARRLEHGGQAVRLGGRALDILILLAERAGEVVSSRELLDTVWRDSTVEEGSLRFHIKNLRKVLGDSQSDTPSVANVPGRGYCFAVPVIRTAIDEPPSSGRAQGGSRTSLPARATEVIGRSDSIETVSRELSRRRCVTITGPAGIGKTTLAIATAKALSNSFDGATVFVDLAPIEDPSLVVSILVSALGLVLRADDPVAAIVEALRDERILIVLDNCEQVVETVARLADRFLRETSAPHMLVTSREPLQIAGERVHRLSPLECPPVNDEVTAGEAKAYAAVQLFVDRAAAAGDGFSLDDASAPAVAEICRRLDGIPLALELAAARVGFFGVAALASRLNNMFAVLTQGRRFALPRHQTLRATLDWGYNLLTQTEQTVLRRIAVFRARLTLDSALAVVVDASVSVDDAVDAMANLVAKSLLSADSTGDAVMYRLLEATRLYATEKLADSQEGSQMARRHAEHHVSLIENAPADWQSHLGKQWLRRHTGRIDDIRAALDWSLSQAGDLPLGLHLIACSARLWLQLSLALEYVGRVERALQRLPDLPRPDAALEMRLHIAFGYAIWYSGTRRDRLEGAFERALELAHQLGDGQAQLHPLWGMWAVRRVRSQYRAALSIAENYAAVAKSAGNQASVVLGERILGLTHHFLGNQEAARQTLDHVQTIARKTGSAPTADYQLSSAVAVPALLARILWLQGFPDQAMAAVREAIDAAQDSDHWFSLYYTLCLAGCPLALWIGDLALTQTYLDMMVNRAAYDGWKGCWALMLRLRQSDTRDGLVASFWEPRVDLKTVSEIVALAALTRIPLPQPEENLGDSLWNLPEVLRVNAELVLWRGEPGATTAAEGYLLRSLEAARAQSTLAWELRTATSLARLWHRSGRVIEARDLLAGTTDRFTEGFDTGDILTARQLLSEWS